MKHTVIIKFRTGGKLTFKNAVSNLAKIPLTRMYSQMLNEESFLSIDLDDGTIEFFYSDSIQQVTIKIPQ